jgi:hypothetical protein
MNRPLGSSTATPELPEERSAVTWATETLTNVADVS